MCRAHYRLSVAFAASLCLVLAACAASPPADQAGDPTAAQPGSANQQQAQSAEPDEIDTEANIWTLLHLAKKGPVVEPGPKTGRTVSPVLWQAAYETLDFVRFASEDPLSGSLLTHWYSPPGKPNERYRISVFILSRALHTDSLAVTVERQELPADGQWKDTPVARQVQTDLETAILKRAGELKREWAAQSG